MRAFGAMLLALCACGRVGFQKTAGGQGDDGEGLPPVDGSTEADAASDAPPIDAALLGTCGSPIDLQLGVRVPVSSCSGVDALDGCGQDNTQEIVVRFTVPADGGYTFRAFDAGTDDVRDSILLLNDDCTVNDAAGCSAVLGLGSLTAGQVLLFVIESYIPGGCDALEVQVD